MTTATSPLRLSYYFVEELSFKANFEHKPTEDPNAIRLCALTEDAVEASLEHGEASGDPLKHRIILNVASVSGRDMPWFFRIRIHGFFDTHEKFMQRPDARDLLCVNGGSMLYTVAREILFSATGRGPFGAAFLPTVRFAPAPKVPPPEKTADGPPKLKADKV